MSSPRRPRRLLASARSSLLGLSLLLLAAHAPAQTMYQGLPAGAKIDWDKVTDARYNTIAIPIKGPRPGTGGGGGGADPSQPPGDPVPGAITTVWIERESAQAAHDKSPITFGQVFAQGEIPRGAYLAGRLSDGTAVPLQVDAKSTHKDGSLRHAVISAIVPAPGARPLALGLMRETRQTASRPTATPAALLRAGLSASVKATLDGRAYTASLQKLLNDARTTSWLAGPVAHEWHATAPLSTASGDAHPHLTARFAVRWYPAVSQARVDVVVENNWAYQPAPQNFTYDAEVTVGGQVVYAKNDLEHYHHARWRKLFWWGGDPNVAVRHDPQHLIATRAVPNYDQSVRVDQSTLARLYAGWKGAKTEPMGVGQALAAMPTTGGRADIGLLPSWTTMYLLESDARAREITMGTADLAGSWPVHYRDRNTGQPVSLRDYPAMTLIGNGYVARNPSTGKIEDFPACAQPHACDTPMKVDVAHQPSLTYLPYLLTGDYYYLEELQFWALYDVFRAHPEYREYRKGLIKPEQVRGQAWGLRSLVQAAYATPDAHPLKDDLMELVDNNLEYYNNTYPRNRNANALGVIVNGPSLVYNGETAIAPWQDDFFTSAVGHAAELGFDKAEPLLAWKARFPTQRMIGTGSCWIFGAMYTMTVRDDRKAPFYSSIAEAFEASQEPGLRQAACDGGALASLLKLRVGEMTGYSTSETGMPSNMQPALAYAADALGEEGMRAWDRFMARSVKPDYGKGPQFAIVPRTSASAKRLVARGGN